MQLWHLTATPRALWMPTTLPPQAQSPQGFLQWTLFPQLLRPQLMAQETKSGSRDPLSGGQAGGNLWEVFAL